MPHHTSRRSSSAPRLGAVAATIAVALTTAFMQPMHGASDAPEAPAAFQLPRGLERQPGNAGVTVLGKADARRQAMPERQAAPGSPPLGGMLRP
jgi:hypothetical protein